MAERTLIIGIDPDTDKSGVATYNQESQQLELQCLPFFELQDYLRDNVPSIKMVIIEAGWLNKSNWHKVRKGSAAINAKIGERTGANFETARKIAEMCKHAKVPYMQIKPLPKNWNGPDKKITAAEFKEKTKYQGRTNQEMRDAGLIAMAFRKMK